MHTQKTNKYLAVVMFLAISAGVQAQYRLPDANQGKCYGGSSAEIACPAPGQAYYGQDAQYQGAMPTYLDKGDGTVFDLNTGLVWQQSDDGTAHSLGLGYCTTLVLAGHTDWRLPSRQELISIVAYGRYDPAIDTDFFPDTRSNSYWSASYWTGSWSEEIDYGPTLATIQFASTLNRDQWWVVDFRSGNVYPNFVLNTSYVRCVRTGP
ncbi:MAG: DUF1566 domain-containing protein [Gammaproteobacteria bacterium]|nr:DUF1566 domain-containing protein [Gammaproteobacteria bacterium]